MRADRLLSLLLALQAKHRFTAAELAIQLDVSERTIYRDIDALSIAGIPVYTQSGPNGGVFLEEGYRTSLTRLTHIEIQSLLLGGDTPQLKDLGLATVSEQTLFKLLATLPSMQRDEAERMRQRFYIDPVEWFQIAEADDNLPTLQRAVWESRNIQFQYQRRDGRLSNREIQPYGLVAKSQAWYLVGTDSQNEMKTFRVSRMSEIMVAENRFERRPDFDLVTYWKRSNQEYEQAMMVDLSPIVAIVRIDPQVRWHFTTSWPTQHVQLGPPDDDLWITLQVEFNSELSARMMLLGLGDQIEVLEPIWFRNAITETLRNSLNRHSGQK